MISRIFGSFVTLAVLIFVFAACSGKKDFTPASIVGQYEFHKSLNAKLENVNRDTATLANGQAISKYGINDLILQKGERFINEDGDYYIVATNCDYLTLIPKALKTDTNKLSATMQGVVEIPTSSCVVSASVKNDKLAIVTMNNQSILYDVLKGTQIHSESNPNPLAINSLIANPVFLETMLLFPTLDGKILVSSTANGTQNKSILVGDEKFFSNILYLHVDANMMAVLTSKRLFTLINGNEFSVEKGFRDAIYHKGYIYAITVDGEVLKYSPTLNLEERIKLPFAILSGLIFTDDALYTMESQGYIIRLSLDNFDVKVYKSNLPKRKNLFYAKSYLYYSDFMIDFATISPKLYDKPIIKKQK